MDVLFQAVDLVPKSAPFLTLDSNFSYEQSKQTVFSSLSRPYNHNNSHHNPLSFQNPSSNGVVPYRNPPPRRTNTNPSTSAFRALNSLVHLSANPVILNTIVGLICSLTLTQLLLNTYINFLFFYLIIFFTQLLLNTY